MQALSTKQGTVLDDAVIDRLAKRLVKRLEPTLRRSVMAASSEGSLLSINEVCDYMSLSRTQFYFLRRGEIEVGDEPLPPFPEPRRHGGSLVWRRRDVDEWVEACPTGHALIQRTG